MEGEIKLKINELKKENIIEHAEKLFSKLGIRNTTMDAIAKEAKISKRTIYIYFSSKKELSNAILCRASISMYNYFYNSQIVP